MFSGSDDNFRHLFEMVRKAFAYAVDSFAYAIDLIVRAWQIAYAGNSIAIHLLGAVLCGGVISYCLVKYQIISTPVISRRNGTERKFLEALRDHICLTNIFTVGVFFITTVVFIVFNTMTAASAYPFTHGDLAVISYVGKAFIVCCVLFRITTLAVTLGRIIP